jgi:predicted ATPase
MLTHLRIKNFKSWRDTGEIRLAPLTVFFGANSSGKSSINQFLMMLKQTVESSDRQTTLHLGNRNTAVELGTFWDLTHHHKVEEGIEFELGDWFLEETTLTVTGNSPKPRSPQWDSLRFVATLGLSEDRQADIVVHQMFYQLKNERKAYLANLIRKPERKQHLQRRLDIGMRRDNDGYLLTFSLTDKAKTKSEKFSSPIHFYGFPPDTLARYGMVSGVTLANLTWNLETQLQNLHYLEALREPPQRFYLRTGGQPESVGWHGEKAIEVLLFAQNKMIASSQNAVPVPLLEQVASWLKIMGLLDSFEVNKIAPQRQDYEVLVKTTAIASQINLTEVGFGVAQILPVIVQCFYAPPHSTTLIEQPEAHLHPSAQSALADLFIEAVQTVDTQGGERHLQLIIESHSEHFLRRLQRRIAEEKISPEEVAIYFCEATPTGSVLKPLEIDEYGNINNWPANFFGDDTGDLVAMTEAAMKRQTDAIVNSA